MIDSSSAEVCSGEVPCLLGNCASRDSFSTLRHPFISNLHLTIVLGERFTQMTGIWFHSTALGAYRNLEINQFLCKCAHLIIETESIFALIFCCKDKIALPLLGALHYCSFVGTNHAVVNVERASRLNLLDQAE